MEFILFRVVAIYHKVEKRGTGLECSGILISSEKVITGESWKMFKNGFIYTMEFEFSTAAQCIHEKNQPAINASDLILLFWSF